MTLILLLFFNLFIAPHIQPKSVDAPPVIKNLIRYYQQSNTLKHGQWSIYAEYVDTGKPIISYHSTESLAPGSGLKVFTTSIALNELGPNYRYKTRLYYDGALSQDSVLHGNIYIEGGGDPTLGSNMVHGSLPLDSLMESWTLALKKAGISKIDGAVIADNTLFDSQTVPNYWEYMDIGNYYGAGVNALSIHNNLYKLYFKPGKKQGDKAEIIGMKPKIPGLHFTNYMKTGFPGSGDQGYIYCAPRQMNAVARGTVPAGVPEFSIKGSIPDPALFAAQYFTHWLKKNGLEVTGKSNLLLKSRSYKSATLITTTYSPTLKDIVYMTNKKSDNLYAETLLKTLALQRTLYSTTKSGTKYILKYLKRHHITTNGLILYDGCGLSRTDAITTKAMVQLLRFMTKQSAFKDFYRSLAIVGDLHDIGYFREYGRHTILANNARIKSGLITGARSHSGYLRDRAGRLIAFSMIANNFKGSYLRIDHIHKKIMLALANLDQKSKAE